MVPQLLNMNYLLLCRVHLFTRLYVHFINGLNLTFDNCQNKNRNNISKHRNELNYKLTKIKTNFRYKKIDLSEYYFTSSYPKEFSFFEIRVEKKVTNKFKTRN